MKLRYGSILALLFFALTLLVGKAAADYLGPDRTRTESYVDTYDWGVWAKPDPTGNSCNHIYGVDCVVCTWERNPGSPCGDATYWYKVGTRYEVVERTVTYPEATINGTLNGCTLQNGWCVTSPALSLTANEPVSGYQILLIEGTRNGETFACQGASCDVPLLEGENTFTFWALSDWGDSSRMGSLTARVDTQPPQVNGELSGTAGENGWYVSPVTFSASASDPAPGSGVASFVYALDGGAWTAYTAPITVGDGVHSITFRVQDAAGHTAEASASVQVDSQPPALQTALDGEQVNGWYLSRVVFTASAADGLSGLARIEYALDGSDWQPYTAPVTIGDGQHTLRVRAFDVAGNVNEAAPLTFQVDGTPPRIELTEAWTIWESGEVTVRDGQSGLSGVEIEIRDPQGRWPKVSRAYEASGERFTTTIAWDRKFADGTLAPIGTYDVVVKAFDRAGNMERVTAHILIPAPNVTPTPLPTRTPTPTATMTATSPVSGSLSLPAQPAPTATLVTISQPFHSSPLPATAPNSSFSVPHSSFPLWGAAAAAAIATATGLALAAKRRRKEEEREQAERARAEVEAKNAALEALKIRNWLMGQAMLQNALGQSGLRQAEQERVRAEARTKGVSAALGLLDSLKQAAQARLEASWRAMEQKIQRVEEATERRTQQQQASDSLDSATRSYMAWSKAVEEEKFDLKAYAWYFQRTRSVEPQDWIPVCTIDNPYGLPPSTQPALNWLIGLYQNTLLPGKTALERTRYILQATENATYLHFSKIPEGDSGFACKYQDSLVWRESSNQIGHFLTAVDISLRSHQSWWKKGLLLDAVIGHEMIGDWAGPSLQVAVGFTVNLLTLGSLHRWFLSGEDRNFEKIIILSRAVNYGIFGRTALQPNFYSGNSIQDLRLSYQGWKFGELLSRNGFENPEDAADWLRKNLEGTGCLENLNR